MMKALKIFFCCIAIFCFTNQNVAIQQSAENIAEQPYKITSPLHEAFSYLPFGEIKPAGWIRAEIVRDLDGMIGSLDKLIPAIMHDDHIWSRDRIAIKDKPVNGEDVTTRPIARSWWNSESQGNWMDGYVREALLIGDPTHLHRIDSLIGNLLASQDPDGYMGIYCPKLRYNHHGDNAELWAKAVALRTLLGYYEATGKKEVLQAVIRATDDVLKKFTENNPPFTRPGAISKKPTYGGLSHGLVFSDVLDRLTQLTGEMKYRNYVIFMYKDFSIRTGISQRDVKLGNILDPAWLIYDHGVHIYEHIRPLTVAAYATGNPVLLEALSLYMARVDLLQTPTGGPVGDENVLGRDMDASKTGYEYCSIHEITDSYSLLMQKSGNSSWGDKAERTYFNAAMGSRHPHESSICYLKFDNAYSLVGHPYLNGLREPEQTSYGYSPTHVDAAVCCVPMAGRISPYFVRSMFMRDEEGLVATLLGPCEVATKVNGADVKISEKTDYPYSTVIEFTVEVSKPVYFVLKIRKPNWATSVRINSQYVEKNGYLVISRKWDKTMKITIDFPAEVQVHTDRNGERYFTWGALVLAAPIEGEQREVKIYGDSPLRDTHYYPLMHTIYCYPSKVAPDMHLMRGKLTDDDLYKSVRLNTTLENCATGHIEKVTLYPVSSTILRQVTFQAK